ncbi:hypothetical protein X975_23025, partial [Stegodyphus mimosarum]
MLISPKWKVQKSEKMESFFFGGGGNTFSIYIHQTSYSCHTFPITAGVQIYTTCTMKNHSNRAQKKLLSRFQIQAY